MQAPALHLGDTIGLVSPSAIPDPEKMQLISAALKGQGYRVRLGKHLFAHGWDYAATDEERAADFTQMALDEDVKLVFFSGGEGADEVLPLLDYTLIAAHPKRYLSFSDGTSILNTLWSRTGMITYYGQTPGDALKELNSYTWQNFRLHMEQPGLAPHIPSAPWRTLRPGEARGTLMGGYLENFLYLLYGGWVRVDPAQDYVHGLWAWGKPRHSAHRRVGDAGHGKAGPVLCVSSWEKIHNFRACPLTIEADCPMLNGGAEAPVM